jgi:hypothetical protein
MNGWQEWYWLVRRERRGPATGERRVEDFVCCEVPVGEDTAMALEVFTSRERAEAELWGMERLVIRTYHPCATNKHRGWSTSVEAYETLSDGVDTVAGYELVEMLDGSCITYVLVDPPPIDEPIPEGLRIELAPVFTEGLGRQPLGEMKKG